METIEAVAPYKSGASLNDPPAVWGGEAAEEVLTQDRGRGTRVSPSRAPTMNKLSCAILSRLAITTMGLSVLANGTAARAQCITTSSTAYWQPFFSGCGVAPTLAVSSNPMLGTTVNLVTTGLPTTTTIVVTALHLARSTPLSGAAIPGLPATCLTFLAPFPVCVFSLPIAGATSIALPIPNNSAYSGLVVYGQSGALTTEVVYWAHTSNAICLYIRP
jgi:hypothetical protein